MNHGFCPIGHSERVRVCINHRSVLQDTARRIARISIEAKLDLDEETYVESFRPHIMDVVHAWASVSPGVCHVTCS